METETKSEKTQNPTVSHEKPSLKDQVIAVLKTCYDPEIPVDIYDLGLIYEINVDEEAKSVHLVMTLTSPMCPVAESLPGEVEQKVAGIAEVGEAKVDLTWDPPWGPDKMSEAAKLTLNID
ncbi:MAG: DUF59 domain-containing protein [Deltaproteobacteria bacterium]|nr:DUF59 domain-containing protein [Deltaproteobacteria bacterium]